MNYAELVTYIEDFSENTFETSVTNELIRLAEQRINNAVQLPAFRKNVTGTLTDGSPYLALPTDFLSSFSLAVISGTGTYTYLLNKDVNFIRECYPNPTSEGTPVHYAFFDADTVIVGPTPDSSYSVELHYFAYPESIVTAGTTWLGDNFESVLLNACLFEAATYMKQDKEMLGMYENRYVQSLTLLKNLGDGKLRQDAYRSGQLRTEVV